MSDGATPRPTLTRFTKSGREGREVGEGNSSHEGAEEGGREESKVGVGRRELNIGGCPVGVAHEEGVEEEEAAQGQEL